MTLRIHMSIHDDDLHKTTAKKNLAGGVAGLDGSGNVEDTSGNDCEIINNKDIVNGYAGLDSNGKINNNLYNGFKKYYFLDNNILHTHDNYTTVASSTYILLKTITLNTLYKSPSILKIQFRMDSTSYHTVYAKIYKNGTAFGIEHSTIHPTVFTENLSFSSGDTIEIWVKGPTTNSNPAVDYFRVLGSKNTVLLSEAITNSNIGIDNPFIATNS